MQFLDDAGSFTQLEQTRSLQAAAGALLGREVSGIQRIRGGGNNKLFRVVTADARYALKQYVGSARDRAERIGHEYGALRLLADAAETAIPQPLGADFDAGLALYEWVDGSVVEGLDTADVASALAFLERLRAYRHREAAQDMPVAVEACLDAASLHEQIARRLRSLWVAAVNEPMLAAFLSERFEPAWSMLAEPTAAALLPRAGQTLSPSDFGRHNMLRRADGSLVFLDFEYFGWDDPVKLVADTVWHPGSALSDATQRQFIDGAQHIFGEDRGYALRLARRRPLFGLRWALIILSEFIPERWERRRRAGNDRNWVDVKQTQLRKATNVVLRAVELGASCGIVR